MYFARIAAWRQGDPTDRFLPAEQGDDSFLPGHAETLRYSYQVSSSLRAYSAEMYEPGDKEARAILIRN